VTVSVLMPVHAGVAPEHFDQALRSICQQSRFPDEIVVVLDGPVSSEHRAVLASYDGVRAVSLPENVGLGGALAAGLELCTSRWVARADADDLNAPDRLSRQLATLESTGADVCSSAMIEFVGEPHQELGVRSCPLTHAAVVRRMKLSNPVNHPTAVFDRELAIRAGGYQPLPFLEDYDLWARMWRAGAVFVGLAEPLVRFRADGMHDRRTGPELKRSERELQRRLVSYGLVSRPRMRLNLVLRSGYRRLPRPLLERAYAAVFRRGGVHR
jgi:glycosyltransferase involved in cell wall biosynthesis